jgi:hypothetical protein
MEKRWWEAVRKIVGNFISRYFFQKGKKGLGASVKLSKVRRLFWQENR